MNNLPASFFPRALLLLSIIFVYASCAAAKSAEATEYLMGTRVFIRVAPCGRDAQADIQEIIQEIRRFDAAASAHRENSFPARLARDGEANFTNEEEKSILLPMLREAFAFARASGGAFDPFIGKLSKLWGFSSLAMRAEPPRADEIAQALAASGHQKLLRLDEDGMAVARHTELDLGAIAKGEMLDRAAARLYAWGYRRALLNFGGDVYVIGDRIDAEGEPWRIAVQHPRKAQAYLGVARIQDGAMATSADDERFFIHEGKRWHHILNPFTGLPASEAVSASVIGPRAALADALATALFVLGADRGLALLAQYPGYHALFVFMSNDILQERMSPGFADAAGWKAAE
ncbi:MAG: FAD:protein FMN transferase [Spirochaetota bacterium]|jgi:thiamine biosynthesis lipoprotein|nr:FAD:protein FMN transferase [Spirochaetota bacterium]